MVNEHTVAVCKRHWTAYWLRVFVAVLLLVYMLQSIPYGNWFDVILSIVVIVLIATCTVFAYKNDQIVLTETKITGHYGVIYSKTLSTPISKIQNIGYSNGPMGKLFHYHTVIIDNAGSGKAEFVFRHAKDAEDFVRIVQSRIR